LGDHNRKRRLDLDLRQKDVAATLGVTESSVTGWEKNRSTPNLSHVSLVIAFLGYTPPPYVKASDNTIENMKIFCLRHGMSQEKLAN
jgi:DNA-binding XRE family transcriptional regulator